MSDKFHLSLERIDNGFITRGPDSNIYYEKPQAAILKLKEFCDVVLKELMAPPAEKK